LLKDREDNRYKVRRQKRRPVVLSSINPSKQKVVIAIRKTLCQEKEVLSFLLVELCSCCGVERKMDYMKVSITSPSYPIRPFVSLDTVYWPVPSVLRFNNVKFSFESKSHC